MVEISNRDELEAWLKGQPREVCVAIAARAALRSLPYLSRAFRGGKKLRNLEESFVAMLRCSLISGVAAKNPNLELHTVAGSAVYDADAMNAMTHSAMVVFDPSPQAVSWFALDHAIEDAGNYASTLSGLGQAHDALFKAGNSVVSALEWDINKLDKGGSLLSEPIWISQDPIGFDAARRDFDLTLSSDSNLNFWERWYEGAMSGNPMDWDMQTEIALIDDKVWKAGAKAVAEKIAEIEAKYLAKATPYAETIAVNPSTGKLHSIPVTLENENLYQTALDKVRDALDDLKEDGELPQHCFALEPIDKKLGRTLDRYARNPQRVHDDFLSAAKEVDRLLGFKEVGDYPEVQALRTDLITGSDDIRAADADVRASVDARVQLRLEEMRVEDTEVAAGILDQVSGVSEGELAESTAEDANTLRALRYVVESGAPDVSGANADEAVGAIYRSAARVSRMAQGWDAIKRAAEGYDTGVKIVAMGGGIITVVGWFLRLLG